MLHFRKTNSDSVLFDSLRPCMVAWTCPTAKHPLDCSAGGRHSQWSYCHFMYSGQGWRLLLPKHDRCALVPCSHTSRYFRYSPTAVGVLGVESDCVALYWSNSRRFFAGADQSLTKSSWIAFTLVSCAKSESLGSESKSKSESQKYGLESDSSPGADSSPTTLTNSQTHKPCSHRLNAISLETVCTGSVQTPTDYWYLRCSCSVP